jgi:hypothetical protein
MIKKLIVFVFFSLAGCSLFQPPVCPAFDQVTPFYFNGSSLWYQKIAANPDIDPNSGKLVAKLIQAQLNKPPIVLSGKKSGFTVFYTDPGTPRYPVPIISSGYPKRGLKSVPIPDYARPPDSSDGHTCFIDNSYSYEFWQFRTINGRWVAGNSAVFDLSGNGINPFISTRASGFSLLSGCIWPQELLAGNIPHALVCAVMFTKKGGPVSPASYSDGWSDDPDALPMGALIQLDPSFDIHSLGMDKYQTAILKALQDYGAYVADTTPSGITFFSVNPLSYSDNPYSRIPSWKDGGYILLDKFPMDKLRIIKLGAEKPKLRGIAHEDLYY